MATRKSCSARLHTSEKYGILAGLAMETRQQPRRRRAATRKLSAREEQVLRQLAWGATHQEVADNLRLSVKTIEAHKANGMRKLSLSARADLVRKAVDWGWLAHSASPNSPPQP